MSRLFRPFPVPTPPALGAALALSAFTLIPHAEAAPARYAGVGWQEPPGMQVTDSYIHKCPGRCVVYEGKEDSFPLIRVHEALPGGGASALTALTTWMRGDRGEVVRVLQNGSTQAGAVTVTLAALSRADGPGDDDPDYSLFVLLEQGGATLPLELYGFSRDDLTGPRFGVLTALADTVRLNPEAIKKDLAFRTQRFANLQKAIADGYARGERTRLFIYSRTSVGVAYAGDLGLQTRVDRDIDLAAFLPGGVFLGAAPAPDYRTPDLRRTGQGELPATWKAVKDGFQVTAPDGKVTLYTLTSGGPQATVKAGGTTYREAVPPKPAELVGLFSTIRTASSSALGTAVFSRSDRDLELRAGGRYLSDNSSFTTVIGANVGGGTGSQGGAGGQWSYDPASLTLTLRPDGGGVRTGPTYTLAYGATRKEKDVDWTLLGEHDWWKK